MKTEKLSLRVEPQLRGRLERVANLERRSVNQIVEICTEKHLLILEKKHGIATDIAERSHSILPESLARADAARREMFVAGVKDVEAQSATQADAVASKLLKRGVKSLEAERKSVASERKTHSESEQKKE